MVAPKAGRTIGSSVDGSVPYSAIDSCQDDGSAVSNRNPEGSGSEEPKGTSFHLLMEMDLLSSTCAGRNYFSRGSGVTNDLLSIAPTLHQMNTLYPTSQS